VPVLEDSSASDVLRHIDTLRYVANEERETPERRDLARKALKELGLSP